MKIKQPPRHYSPRAFDAGSGLGIGVRDPGATNKNVPLDRMRITDHLPLPNGGRRLTMSPVEGGHGCSSASAGAVVEYQSRARGRPPGFSVTPAGGEKRPIRLAELNGLFSSVEAQLDENPEWSDAAVKRHLALRDEILDRLVNSVVATGWRNLDTYGGGPQ
jgi:hypothetical protein